MFRRLIFAVVCMSLALTSLTGAEIPRQAPEFVIKLPKGNDILLSQYRGHPVVLAFILTTCPHCQVTCGKLEKLYKEYGPQGLQVVAVATNDMANMLVPEFAKNLGLTFPVGYVPKADPAYEFLQQPMMLRMFMPQLVFIDRKGVIRAQYAGDDAKFFKDEDQENNIRAEVLKLQKEAPAAKRKSSTHKTVAKKGAS